MNAFEKIDLALAIVSVLKAENPDLAEVKLTQQEIADIAEVSRGSVYYYFKIGTSAMTKLRAKAAKLEPSVSVPPSPISHLPSPISSSTP